MKRLPSPSLASSGSRASWRFPKTNASVASMAASSTPSKASMYAQCTEQFPGEKLLTRSPHNARISAHAQESGNNTHASAKQKPAPQTHAVRSNVLPNIFRLDFRSWKHIFMRRDSQYSTALQRNVSWMQNQHIRMISEASCDTEDWSNDAENSAFASEK